MSAKKDNKKKDHPHETELGKDKIVIRGAKTHNLKNITLEIPRNKMVVFTGLSGSGKSSLAFDTIFAEGQRRYVESLSAYARQFLNQMQKPDVEEITGLSPAISIDQKSRSNNPRSTVATITEIYDYLRIFYARVGQPYCLHHDHPIEKLSKEEILKIILRTIKEIDLKKNAARVKGVVYSNAKLRILSPIVVGRKGEYYQKLYDLLGKGYERVVVDGTEYSLRGRIELSKTKRHDIDVVIDELFISELSRDDASRQKQGTDGFERLSEAVELALKESNGLVKIESPSHQPRLLIQFAIRGVSGMQRPRYHWFLQPRRMPGLRREAPSSRSPPRLSRRQGPPTRRPRLRVGEEYC